MREFQDSKGRAWTIHVTLGVARVIKSQFGIDLLEPDGEDNRISAFAISINKRLDMLWMLISEQAKHESVTRDDFEESMEGSQIRAAIAAVDEEFLFFIQNFDPTLSAAFGSLLTKSRDLQMIALEKLTAFIEKKEHQERMRSELDAALESLTPTLHETVGNASGNQVASYD